MQSLWYGWGVAVVLVLVVARTPAAGEEVARVGPTSDGRGWVAPDEAGAPAGGTGDRVQRPPRRPGPGTWRPKALREGPPRPRRHRP